MILEAGQHGIRRSLFRKESRHLVWTGGISGVTETDDLVQDGHALFEVVARRCYIEANKERFGKRNGSFM